MDTSDYLVMLFFSSIFSLCYLIGRVHEYKLTLKKRGG